MAAIATLDIQASGLGKRSYPIEVGFVQANGYSRCFLIRPEPNWQYWDKDVEQLHGLSRQTLVAYGKPVAYVANILNRYLVQQTVYCDNWADDSRWLSQLYESAGIKQLFKLESIYALLAEPQQAMWQDAKFQIEARMDLQRHRASSDAKLVQQTWRQLEKRTQAV